MAKFIIVHETNGCEHLVNVDAISHVFDRMICLTSGGRFDCREEYEEIKAMILGTTTGAVASGFDPDKRI